MFNSRTGKWTVLPECPKMFFSIAVVNGQLTAIGGGQSYEATNTLLSLSRKRLGIFQQKWIEQFPPMTYGRNAPAVATTNTSLIVAGGWSPYLKNALVEMMDIQTLQWATVASLPYPLDQATATICGDRLYIGGGITGRSNKSVVMCEVKDLLQSQPQSLATRPGLSSSPPVWKEVTPLAVKLSSLVTFQGQLLAVGGSTTGRDADSTSDVMQYDVTTNSWKVISRMKVKRNYCFAAVLPNSTLMVCGGFTPDGDITVYVELASV
ncbi:Kelch-like protein 10 [Geodia barretti]|uniref:Kelch-like protein 10 n=1 Tax=Geodia barretti TaxID=519541 RepID=A0AA35SH31_GEOBA|nr:Kelch-like protein 10 [Geodia barretti]